MPLDLSDESNFRTSNISIDSCHSVWRIIPGDYQVNQIVAISHGSNGITQSEIEIADFFLSKGFEVELFDHFSSLGIEKLNWGYSEEYQDHFQISLLDYLNSIDLAWSRAQYHIGLSIGGYFGLSSPLTYRKCFAIYPGILPLWEKHFKKRRDQVYVFEAELDSWTRLPQSIRNLLNRDQIFSVSGAHHSFMARDKDKLSRVISMEFRDLLVDEAALDKVFFSYDSMLSCSNQLSHVRVPLKSNLQARQKVLERVVSFMS